MSCAYNTTWLANLKRTKAAKQWSDSGIISKEQLAAIRVAHPSGFYHPNIFIRVLLFLATQLGLSGLIGLVFLAVQGFENEGKAAGVALVVGILMLLFVDFLVVRSGRHYKSGVAEGMLYFSMGLIALGLFPFFETNEWWYFVALTAVVALAAYRFLDLIGTITALVLFGSTLFYKLDKAGLIAFMPFVFILVYGALYFAFNRIQKMKAAEPWSDCLILAEGLCLLTVYAAGNYLVVREMSTSLMGLQLAENQNIPFAFLFYITTVLVPVAYLFFGIKNKDLVLIRVSLAALAFSVFTFKYYFSLGHPEITLTLAGAILLAVSIALMRWLKTPRSGFTRENLLSEKWGNANLSAFVVSQTMGAMVPKEVDATGFGGGESGGGGAETKF